MTERDDFWTRVERVRAHGGHDLEAVAMSLEDELRSAPDADLVAFGEQLLAEHERLNTWRHLAAAEVMIGYVSDDVFTDWRSWVIAQGRQVHDAAVADPDSLAAIEDWHELETGAGEIFGAAAITVHAERHGYETPFPVVELVTDPAGERVPHEQRAQLFPRLSAHAGRRRTPFLLRLIGRLLRRGGER
jgi:hypothetical protein